MKFATLFLVPLAVSASAISIARRQLGRGGLLGSQSSTVTTQKSLRVETDFKPSITRNGVKRVRVWYGPYKIRPVNSKTKTENGRSMDPGGTAWTYLAGDLPRDITILSANASVVYKDETVIDKNNGLYNHHLLIIDTSKGAPTIAVCPSGRGVQPPGMSMISGSSEDKGGAFFSTKDGQFNSGYYLGKTDRIVMSGDIVNYTNDTREVYSLLDLQYIEGKPTDYMEAVTQLWSVGQCDGQTGFIHPAPGVKKFSIKSKPMNVTQPGHFLAFRGHLHDGGVNLVAKVNGKTICDSHAFYGGPSLSAGEQGSIDHMGYCFGPVKVGKGDTVTLEANYDLELHPPRQQHGGGMAEEMALMSIFFASENPK